MKSYFISIIKKSIEAHDRDRTGDLILTKDVLYLLSYMGKAMKIYHAEINKILIL
jgi:hypothetical protein